MAQPLPASRLIAKATTASTGATHASSQKELPGITLAWVTMLEVLPNGNVIIGNCHATEANPQLIEVTPDKKVVWVLQDWTKVGDGTALQVLDDPGIPEVPGDSEH